MEKETHNAEFLKCTEDDRAWRIRMVAGEPFFGATFLRANKKGGKKNV